MNISELNPSGIIPMYFQTLNLVVTVPPGTAFANMD